MINATTIYQNSGQAISYLNKRLNEIACPPEKNLINSPNYVGKYGESAISGTLTFPLFESDPDDNIVINYFSLLGRPYSYRRESNKWAHRFTRIRFKTPIVHKDGSIQKYSSPKESGMRPFFTPGIIEKYFRKEKISVLIVTEGEFKAFKGYLEGLDIIGIPSIHGFSEEKKLHQDIIELIKRCEVEKVVYLTDADTLTISYLPDKDLYKRPNSFYTAVKNFREYSSILLNDETKLKDIYFAHIHTKYWQTDKGLDDLLINNNGITKEIIRELNHPSSASSFFHFINISDGNLLSIRNYFGLKDEVDFYSKYGSFIGTKEFVFRNGVYQFNGEEVTYLIHKEADEFMRIGDDWMRLIQIPNRHGELEEVYKKWKISEIQRDYKKFPGFLDQVKKYKGFVNIPCNDENYRREHQGFFNIHNPINHELQEGDIANSIYFLKHLFGGEGNVKVVKKDGRYSFYECVKLGDPFTIILDYLTIKFNKPDQILPVVCLVSPENNTGKSTFLKWQKDIYGSNATIVGNEQFKMPFNSHYITKFIIGIDESFIELDKKADKERIKKLATDERQFLEFKGIDVQEFDYYGKIIICSNEADNLMKIEEGEIRWFVIKVPQFPKEDPHFRDKLKKEIPAWLHFLKHRKVFHPHEGRAWFSPEYLVTEQLLKVINTTKPKLEKIVEEFISDMFLRYRQAKLKLHLDYIIDAINSKAKYKIDKVDLKKYLKDKKKLLPEKQQRIKIPDGFTTNLVTKTSHIYFRSELQRPYAFIAEDWLSDVELEEFNTPLEDSINTNNTEDIDN